MSNSQNALELPERGIQNWNNLFNLKPATVNRYLKAAAQNDNGILKEDDIRRMQEEKV